MAEESDFFENLKNKLAETRLQSPLIDTARFTNNLEKAYKTMWQIYQNGEVPRQIEVAPD